MRNKLDWEIEASANSSDEVLDLNLDVKPTTKNYTWWLFQAEDFFLLFYTYRVPNWALYYLHYNVLCELLRKVLCCIISGLSHLFLLWSAPPSRESTTSHHSSQFQTYTATWELYVNTAPYIIIVLQPLLIANQYGQHLRYWISKAAWHYQSGNSCSGSTGIEEKTISVSETETGLL